MDESSLALRHEHAFDIRINFDKRWMLGPVSGGAHQGYTSIGAGSTVSGPRLNGKLVDYSGADWPAVRTDGVVELNAHYMIQADDGTLIYIRNLGYVHGPLRTANQQPEEPPAIRRVFSLHALFPGATGHPRMVEPHRAWWVWAGACRRSMPAIRPTTRCFAITPSFERRIEPKVYFPSPNSRCWEKNGNTFCSKRSGM